MGLLPADPRGRPWCPGRVLDRGARLDEAELALLEGFAAQCSQALIRIASLERERAAAGQVRHLAEELQQALLTPPPSPAGLEIAVRYRSAADQAQVGGDWYDAFVDPEGATTVVVGDVVGHDSRAAATMGQLRGLVRVLAYEGPSTGDRTPAAVLRRRSTPPAASPSAGWRPSSSPGWSGTRPGTG